MELQQLRIFIAVAEARHVTRAAERLGVTQPAASSAIRSLERRYGARLFNRVGRGIELTETGRHFLPHARAVLDRVEAARAVLEDEADLPTGTVRIASSQTIAGYWLPRRLSEFLQLYPSVHLEIHASNSEDAEKAVVSGDADVGLVGRTRHGTIVRNEVAADRLVLIKAADYAGIGLNIRASDLRKTPWIVREEGAGTRSALEQMARRMGVNPAALPIFLVLPSNEAVREAVEAGYGVGVISEHVVRHSIAAGRLQEVGASLTPRAFAAIHHRDRELSKAQQVFLRFLVETGAEYGQILCE